MTYTGRLYAIRSRNTEKIYIGFTFDTLIEELSLHVYNYKYGLSDSSSEIIKHDEYYIELLKIVQCERKQDMLIFKNKEIKTNENNAVNILPKKETYIKISPEYSLCQCGSKLKTKFMKQHLLTKKHTNYTKGIPKKDWKEKIKCECGLYIGRKCKYAHVKTPRHILRMAATA